MGTMAKKTSKQQPKQANTANFGDTPTPPAITTEPTEKTLPVTAPTANTLPKKADARQPFREFVKITDFETIKRFLTTAISSPEYKNLELLWGRAFEEGHHTRRHALINTLEDKLERSFDSGYKQGFEEG